MVARSLAMGVRMGARVAASAAVRAGPRGVRAATRLAARTGSRVRKTASAAARRGRMRKRVDGERLSHLPEPGVAKKGKKKKRPPKKGTLAAGVEARRMGLVTMPLPRRYNPPPPSSRTPRPRGVPPGIPFSVATPSGDRAVNRVARQQARQRLVMRQQFGTGGGGGAEPLRGEALRRW
jgi:hypothetical protein